ncbi:MAG: protocatechuate 3,4-dioxygenase [Gammaproteobacteria bacterium]|jgi:3-O-methylgallate 3,4-dioxygenase
MAEIVAGIATSHGPMLVTPPQTWGARVPDDRKATHAYRGGMWSFDELVEMRQDELLNEQISEQVWANRHARCQTAIDALARRLAEARADVAIIFGNDQMEAFRGGLIPALCVFNGESLVSKPMSAQRLAQLPQGVRSSIPGYIPETGATYAAYPELGNRIVAAAVAGGFDVATMNRLPHEETPHAFGFVYRRLMHDAPMPSVPILLNTFYPPNQPPLRRCFDFGGMVARAVSSWESDARVALIASGGLSHFVIDESLDQAVLDALGTGDIAALERLGEARFQDGSSEIKNWIPLAGAMTEIGFRMAVIDYVPCYRSEAGTGNAMGFASWSR